MDQIIELWPSLFAALIVPLLNKIKAWAGKNMNMTTDIPILWYSVSAGLSIGLAFFLKWLIAPEAPADELVRFILTNVIVVGTVHATWKTPGKIKEK